jgi:transcriptional regulator with XRE-family HTH domain
MHDMTNTGTNVQMAGAPTFAGRLQQSRRWVGLRQEQIADVVGVTRRTVSSWEHGITTPSVDQLLAWARATGFPPSWFLPDEVSAVTRGSLQLGHPAYEDPPPLIAAA